MTIDTYQGANPQATEQPREPKLDLASLAEIAAWMAQVAAEGALGGAVFAYLDNFRRRFGQRRVEGLKEQVYAELKRLKRKPQVSDADLRLRVERLFDQDRGD